MRAPVPLFEKTLKNLPWSGEGAPFHNQLPHRSQRSGRGSDKPNPDSFFRRTGPGGHDGYKGKTGSHIEKNDTIRSISLELRLIHDLGYLLPLLAQSFEFCQFIKIIHDRCPTVIPRA
jgi:hypothetical protein